MEYYNTTKHTTNYSSTNSTESTNSSSNSTGNSTRAVSSPRRVRPSDEEFIVHYLGNEIKKLRPTHDFPINQFSFYHFTPHKIVQFADVCENFGEKEWYIMVLREERYNERLRVPESCDGYWKATSKAQAVMNNNGDVVVGFKTDFAYYHDLSSGFKTNWFMTEYCIDPLLTSPRIQWALCRLYHQQHQTAPITIPNALRSRPSDEEFIVHYLGNKIKNLPRTSDFHINGILFQAFTPDDIVEFFVACEVFGEKEWYFFVHRENMFNGRIRVPDSSEGYWKATSEAKEVINNEGVVVGFKTDFAYYHDMPGFKTNWFMNE